MNEIYTKIERLRRLEAERAHVEMIETKSAICAVDQLINQSIAMKCNALNTGKSFERAVAATISEIGSLQRSHLEDELDLRSVDYQLASNNYMGARQWKERLKQLVDASDTRSKKAQEKREQFQLDEYYLAVRCVERNRRQ